MTFHPLLPQILGKSFRSQEGEARAKISTATLAPCLTTQSNQDVA